MAVIFALSSRPLPQAVSRVPDWTTHGAGYAILCALVCRALAGGLIRPVTTRVAVLAVAISVLYGVTDELHQSFVPGRDADPWDLVKDLGGATLAALACAWPRAWGAQRRKAA
jgi:VanZ family protein